MEFFTRLYSSGTTSLSGSSGAAIIHSPNQMGTKSMAQNMVYIANQLGCSFMGHPLVEATAELENLHTWQKRLDLPLGEIAAALSKELGRRLCEYNPVRIQKPNVLALHASFKTTSNTLELWHMVLEHLAGCDVTELHVGIGEVLDCKGCPYKTCMHYSMQNSCFYGGIMVKEVLPAIERADAVVWICPNYNDAVSANLMAVINRLTALYRKISFYSKTMFAVIVSGNSGSDSVAKQLIGALNINKGFRLPQNFYISAIANDAGEIRKVPGIEEAAREFAGNLINEIRA
jgi:multimeric flavodoxin WrbA